MERVGWVFTSWDQRDKKKMGRISGPYRIVTEEELQRGRVSDGTRYQYKSRLRAMRKLGYPLTVDGLCARICRIDSMTNKSLLGLATALSWHLESHGRAPISAEQQHRIKNLLRGRLRETGGRLRKGAITYELLLELLEWTHGQAACTRQQRREIRIAWGCGLRTSQVARLRRYDFVRVRDRWALYIEECHRPDRADREEPRMQLQYVEDRVQHLLDQYLPLLDDDDLVCPEWNGTRINGWIKRCAQERGWDPSLSWKGVHQLRHGVAVDVMQELGAEMARQLLGHAARRRQRTVTDHYSETNEARVAAHQRGERRRAAKRAKRSSKKARKAARRG